MKKAMKTPVQQMQITFDDIHLGDIRVLLLLVINK
jgi:hypothetical protein